MVKTFVIFLCVSALVLTAVVTYSLCVMAKDEDDAEQVKWLCKQSDPFPKKRTQSRIKKPNKMQR